MMTDTAILLLLADKQREVETLRTAVAERDALLAVKAEQVERLEAALLDANKPPADPEKDATP